MTPDQATEVAEADARTIDPGLLAQAYLEVVAHGATGRRGDRSRRPSDDVARWLEQGRKGAGHHVDALRIEPGVARLSVPVARGRRPEVVVTVSELRGQAWNDVVEAAGHNLRSTADLLAGRLPVDLAEPSLLVPSQVTARCSLDHRRCPHVALTHHVIAAAIRRDPFRLLEWRGHRRQELLTILRQVRGVQPETQEELDLRDPWQARGPLDMQVHPIPPRDVAALLDRMGPPPGIDDPTGLEQSIAAAADMAWRLAAGEGADVADDEVLLAQLRAQRVTSAELLANALGLELDVVTEHLERLYDQGLVLRMGSGDSARYRAG